jgi:hypothetical protein
MPIIKKSLFFAIGLTLCCSNQQGRDLVGSWAPAPGGSKFCTEQDRITFHQNGSCILGEGRYSVACDWVSQHRGIFALNSEGDESTIAYTRSGDSLAMTVISVKDSKGANKYQPALTKQPCVWFISR